MHPIRNTTRLIFLLTNGRHLIALAALAILWPLGLPLAARAIVPRRIRYLAWGWITGGTSRLTLRLILVFGRIVRG